MKAKREAWLDGLKGFAILLVILGHVLSGYLDANTFPDAYYSLYGLRSWIYSFHMPLFFLLSGFTFTLAYYQGGTLTAPPVFPPGMESPVDLCTVCTAPLGRKAGGAGAGQRDLYHRGSQGDVPHPIGELLVSLCAAGIISCGGAGAAPPGWNSMWLLLLGGCAIVVADVHMDWTQLTLYRIIYHLFFFGVGCMLCKNRKLLSIRTLWVHSSWDWLWPGTSMGFTTSAAGTPTGS